MHNKDGFCWKRYANIFENKVPKSAIWMHKHNKMNIIKETSVS